MSNNPLMLGIRFLLELVAWYLAGYWGYAVGEGPVRYVLMLLLPAVLAAIWGVFRVPNDPGNAPVAVRGFVRLLVEFFVFGVAAFALFDLQMGAYAWVFIIVLVLHYILSYDRVIWLLKQ